MITIFGTADEWSNWRNEQALMTWEAISSKIVTFDVSDVVIDGTPDGTPYLPSLFKYAESFSKMHGTKIMVYSNSDILLTRSLVKTIWAMQKAKLDRFLVVGRRHNWPRARVLSRRIAKGVKYCDVWEDIHLREILDECTLFNAATDYFVFPRGMFDYDKWPNLIIGRYWWDPWIFWHAMEQGVPVIDATRVVTVIHQDHPKKSISPAEFNRNRELAKGVIDAGIDLDDVPYYLNEDMEIVKR